MQISWSLEPILFSFYFRTRLIIHFLSKIFPFHYDWSRYIVWNGAMLVLALSWKRNISDFVGLSPSAVRDVADRDRIFCYTLTPWDNATLDQTFILEYLSDDFIKMMWINSSVWHIVKASTPDHPLIRFGATPESKWKFWMLSKYIMVKVCNTLFSASDCSNHSVKWNLIFFFLCKMIYL